VEANDLGSEDTQIEGGDMNIDQAQPVKRAGLFGWLLHLKTLMVVFSLVGLLASNVVSVLHAGFHQFLYEGIYRAAMFLGAERAELVSRQSKEAEIKRRVQEETASLRNQADAAKQDAVDAKAREQLSDGKRATLEADLKKERANLQSVNSALSTERTNLARANGELEGVNGRIKKMKPALEARLATGVSRNLAAIPAESIPYVGVAVVLAVTAADLKDACDTMKDFNTLLVELGRGEKDPDFCGRKVPSKEEVWSDVKKNAKGTYQRAKIELDKVQTKVPDFSWPTLGDFCLKGMPGC
jgi:hypothetical protein